jgi:hypothetical protein
MITDCRSARFSPAEVFDVLQHDPGAIYYPPSRPCGGDDFIELSEAAGGGYLPNRERAAAWVRAMTAAGSTRPGR